MKTVTVCLYEDRQDCALGLKLLVLSAKCHEPTWMFNVFLKNIAESDRNWLSLQSNVRIREEIPQRQNGWNVKPYLLKLLLLEDPGPLIWCDSDIILSSPISKVLESIPPFVFVASEEYGWGRNKGSRLRTSGWGFIEKRSFTNTVNSSFMRMDTSHMPLLDAWAACLARPSYQQSQAQPWDQRPVYFVGDQDALTALLASSDHAHIPVHLLRNGWDIAQCFEEDGYTAHHRVLNSLCRRTPPLIHAQGGKPWKNGPRAVFEQLSAYASVALPYVTKGSLPSDWIRADESRYQFLDWFSRGDANLRGLLPAVQRTSRRARNHWSRLFRL